MEVFVLGHVNITFPLQLFKSEQDSRSYTLPHILIRCGTFQDKGATPETSLYGDYCSWSRDLSIPASISLIDLLLAVLERVPL